jgi:hypothetical protein
VKSIGTDPREGIIQNREPWLAASLSWVLPGAGQLYSRLWVTGIALILLQVSISEVGVARESIPGQTGGIYWPLNAPPLHEQEAKK